MRLTVGALLITLSACGGAAARPLAQMVTSSTIGTSTTTATAASSDGMSTTTGPARSDNRVHKTVDLQGQYFRVDPPPDNLQPRLTATQALARFRAGQFADAGNPDRNPGVHVTVRFGLYSGQDAFTGPPPAHLAQARQVDRQPAWIVILTGYRLACTMCKGEAAPTYGLTAIRDSDGHSYGSLIQNGGTDPGIE